VINKKDTQRAQRRAFRVRMRLKTEGTLPRVSVFRSLKYIYVQLIDDNAHATIASCSSLELKKNSSGDKKEVAHIVGLELAKRMKEKGVEKAFFDRGRFRYHGRVQALVEGLREGGIQI
jgi:large subunit ribosomal protein L18